jgi:monoamine oxidase
VTDSQKNVTALLKDLNIETYKQFADGKKVLELNGKQSTYSSNIPKISPLGLIDLKWIMTKFNIGAKRISTLYPFENIHLANHLDSINLEQYLYTNSLSTKARSIMECAIKTIYGLESTQLNSLFALMYGKSGGGSVESLCFTEKDCAQEKRIKYGAQQISQKLLNRILDSHEKASNKILFNTQLMEINQNESNLNEPCVVVTKNTQSGLVEKFYAKKIISSIPINHYVNVKFSPELPFYKRNVFKFCQFGNYSKFIVTYEKQFWKDKGFSGEVLSDGSILHFNENKFNEFYEESSKSLAFNKQAPTLGPISCLFDATTSDNQPGLIGFIAGKAAVEWHDLPEEMRKKEIIECLVRYFGDEARDYVDFMDKDWNSEPFTGGNL